LIKAILIDDERDSLELLHYELEQNCPEVVVAACCSTSGEAIDSVRLHKPDLVFLDIRLPEVNGFELLDMLARQEFDVIIITAHEEYASKAFDYEAIDYLLKPIDSTDLVNAVRRFKQKSTFGTTQLSTPVKKDKPLNNQTEEPRLRLVKRDAIIYFINLKDYLKLIMNDGQSILVNMNVSKKENLVSDRDFVRISKNCTVNKHHISSVIDKDAGILMMSNGDILRISKKYRHIEFS
jgi:two-component system LytT family response regulator